MKLLTGLLCTSLLVLANCQDGYSQRMDDGQGMTYERTQTDSQVNGVNVVKDESRYIDSSVNREGADFTGAYNYHIGHQGNGQNNRNLQPGEHQYNNQGNQEGGRTRLFEHGNSGTETRPRVFDPDFDVKIQNRMGQSGVEVQQQPSGIDVQQRPSGQTINMRDSNTRSLLTVNFESRQKRDVATEQQEIQPDQELSRQKRGYYNAKVHYSNEHRHDESINMNRAQFQGANNFNIGHKREKRDMEQMNGEEQVVPREKRQYFNAEVDISNSYAHDKSINMNGAQFQGANNFNIGHRGKRDVEVEQKNPQPEEELSRQKRAYYNAEIYYKNDHRVDESINMEGAVFDGANNFNIGHKREKRDVETEQKENQPETELSRQKRKFYGVEVYDKNDHRVDEFINENGAIFNKANNFNIRDIRYRRKRDAKEEQLELSELDKTGREINEIEREEERKTELKKEAYEGLVRQKRKMDWGSSGSVDQSYNLQGANFKGAHHFEITRGRSRVFN